MGSYRRVEMGQWQSSQHSDKTSQHSDERSIILLGETGAGKSAFGNFLLNSNNCFKTGTGMLSTTQTVEQQSCQYTEDSLSVALHVFDLPGLNDPRKIDTTHLRNTHSAVKNCAKSMSTLFAIVIDISNRDELVSAVAEVHTFINKVELPDFNLTDNALLVFSHADKLGTTPQEQESSLEQVLESCIPLYRLYTLVRFRRVLVDSSSTDREYRVGKMREIIGFTRPRIRVLLLGPHLETQNELLLLLREKMGVTDALPGYCKDEVDRVSVECEGCSLTFEKSFEFSSLDTLKPSDNFEKSNALTQIGGLINSLVETHTFTAFCVLIRMDVKLKSSFIEGIKSLASSISGDKLDMFYDRCFFLFTHSNCDNAEGQARDVFGALPAMKQLRSSMGERVAVVNKHPDTGPDALSAFFKQVVAFSHAMKKSCYGKEFVSSVLSAGFDVPPSPTNEAATESTALSVSRYLPSKRTLALLTLGGGGILALAGGAAVLLTGGAAAPAVAVPMMLFAAQHSVPAAGLAVGISTGVLGGTLGIVGVGANTAVAGAVLYKLLTQQKKKEGEQEEEFEYDFSSGKFEISKS